MVEMAEAVVPAVMAWQVHSRLPGVMPVVVAMAARVAIPKTVLLAMAAAVAMAAMAAMAAWD